MACSLYFISVYLVSKNPEILSNPMPQNQINGVDETANVTVGFDRHNALIWSFKAKISAFQGELQSYNLFLLNIDFYWLRRNFLSFFLPKLPWFRFIFHMEQNLTQKVQNLRWKYLLMYYCLTGEILLTQITNPINDFLLFDNNIFIDIHSL